MANNFWTPEEDAILRRNARGMNVRELAEILPRSESSINSRASYLDLKIKPISAVSLPPFGVACPDDSEHQRMVALQEANRVFLEALRAEYMSRPALSRVEA